MAKAGLGKGNAFKAPGPSYPHLELVRLAAREREVEHKNKESALADAVDFKREGELRAIAQVIDKVATRERVKKEMGYGILRARRGLDPFSGKLDCAGCKRPGKDAHHFLCAKKEKFKTNGEKLAFAQFESEVRKYADERRTIFAACEHDNAAPPIADSPSAAAGSGGSSSTTFHIPPANELLPAASSSAGAIADTDESAEAAIGDPETDGALPCSPPQPMLAAALAAAPPAAAASSIVLPPLGSLVLDQAALAAIEAARLLGLSHASKRKILDKVGFEGFADSFSIYKPRRAEEGPPTKEAAWLRREMTGIMNGISLEDSPFPNGEVVSTISKPTIARGRPGTPALKDLRQRPCAYNFIVHGSKAVVVNWGSKHNKLLLEEAGLGNVPCANDQCCGHGGLWHTKVVKWGHTTGGPKVFVDELGRPGPMDVAYSICEDCQAAGRSANSFSHLHPMVLARLADTELLGKLPFDASYQFEDVFLHRAHTR